MEKQRNIPHLRFPEFEKEWDAMTLGNIAMFSKGKGLSKCDISENGVTECIRYGELYTTYNETINTAISKTNINPNELVLSETNDIIIPASGETHIDIAKASCVLKSGVALGGDLNIIRTPNNGVFLSYYLNSSKKQDIAQLAQGISVVHLYAGQLSKLRLNLPTFPEQQKIASFFTAIDKKISQLKQKKTLLEHYKKGVMQKIFSQQIRFKDDNGQEYSMWEKKRLGELTFKTSKKNKDNAHFPIYSINNKEGFLPQGDQFEGVDSNSRGYDISLYKVIDESTFAYNPARINVGSIGYSGNLKNIIISSLYVCFKTKQVLEDAYLLQYLKTYQFNKSVLQNVEGGVRDYLFYENFSNIKISLPCNKEQLKIANFLSIIDDKINCTQKQIEKAEVWKKGLMQQMFV